VPATEGEVLSIVLTENYWCENKKDLSTNT